MTFYTQWLNYDEANEHSVLDFSIDVSSLKDDMLVYVSGNYSLTGFELKLKRNSFKYLINYYLPSGLFVVVSWVSVCSLPNIE